MLVCKECGSPKVQELYPCWVDANTGEAINGESQWKPMGTYCEGCEQQGVLLICEEDALQTITDTDTE